MRSLPPGPWLAALFVACSSAPPPPEPTYGQPGTTAAFDLEADTALPARFFALPWPSDLRLLADGRPELAGFPNPSNVRILEGLRTIAAEGAGFSVVPVLYFRFDAPIGAHAEETIPAARDAPVQLLDVDAASPRRGERIPVVLATPAEDGYVPRNLLAVAPRPGFVLAPRRAYAVLILRSLGDASSQALGVPPALDMLRRGRVPDGRRGPDAERVYSPLWATLEAEGTDTSQVAAATVFTTGDAVAETAALSSALLSRDDAPLTGLAPDTTASASNDRVCKLTATIDYPQYQQGSPPFDAAGLFVRGSDGLPVVQRRESAPVTITLPRTPMPQAGYPLVLYFHGSGGVSNDVLDKGPTTVAGGLPSPGLGPGWVHAQNGVAAAGSALPVNPERLPGAGETAYLNIGNPAAMRDTFRQGVVEQRLFLRSLLSLSIPATMVAGCGGTVLPTLPASATAFRFDPDRVIAQGQSMGGMYTNLVSAVEPRIKIAVPTGAGGYWSFFILKTSLYQGLPELLATIFETATPLSFTHPVMSLLQQGYEPSDPLVSMPRLAFRPLPGSPVRSVYEPVGRGDQYFPTGLYDAVALAYRHQQAGTVQWASMQDALRLGGLDGLLTYPVSLNLSSETGERYTGVVVQHLGDGIEDPHAIYRQLEAVKAQYACFVGTWLRSGRPVVIDPSGACP